MRTDRGMGGVTSLINDPHGTALASVHNTALPTQGITKHHTLPFGDARGDGAAPPGDHRFLGAPQDATGLVMLGARYYDPATGRFLSVDPIMDLTSPQQWNAYSYGNNNPNTYTDPDGLEPRPWHDPGTPMPDPGEVTERDDGAPRTGGGSGTSAPPIEVEGGVSEVIPVVNIYVGDGSDIPLDGLPAGTWVPADIAYTLQSNPGNYPWASEINVITMPCTEGDILSGVACEGSGPRTAIDIAYMLFVEDYVDCADGKVSGCIWVAVGFTGVGKVAKGASLVLDVAKYSDEIADAGSAASKSADEAGVLTRYDADFALGQLTRGGKATASQLDEFGSSQGWIRSQTANGPVKYRDQNGVVRLTIKQGSPRAAGSGNPHVEMRNTAGNRIDPYGNEVTRKSKGNHTPIVWDW